MNRSLLSSAVAFVLASAWAALGKSRANPEPKTLGKKYFAASKLGDEF
jgi:hypothetical protein